MDQSGRPKGELRRPVEPAVRLARAGLPGRILGRLIEVGFLERSVILVGQAFSAILPLVMLLMHGLSFVLLKLAVNGPVRTL